MRKWRMQGWLAGILMAATLLQGTPAQAEVLGRETAIKPTQPVPSRAGIDMSDRYVVWMNKDDRNQGIVLYDLKTGAEKQRIAADGTDKTSPKVDGDSVVWIDQQKGLYHYDIVSDKKRLLPIDARDPVEVDLSGDYIVWLDRADGNLYLYDSVRDEQTKITRSGKASSPYIDSYYVVWEDYRDGNYDVYAYDLSRGEEIVVTTNRYNQRYPSVYRDLVVYQDDRNGHLDIYSTNLRTGREERLTSNSRDQELPRIYDDYVLYLEEDSLRMLNLSSERDKVVERIVDPTINYVVFGDYALYAMEDGRNPKLTLYDLYRDETIAMGGAFSNPSDPDGDDYYLVFLSNNNSVVLYDIEAETAKIISQSGQRPRRPLVSDQWVVFYDRDKRALFSYSIKAGRLQQITDSSHSPSDSLYELEGNKLLWFDGRSSGDLNLTNLSTNSTTRLASLRDAPLNVDINEEFALWLEEYRDDSIIHYYDLNKRREYTIERRLTQVENARLGEDEIVWTEYTDGYWQIHYYSHLRGRVYPMFQNVRADQINPQTSRGILIYESDDYSGRFEPFIYDINAGRHMFSFSSSSNPRQLRLSANRAVWIDEGSRDSTLYTMAFSKPRADAPDNEGPGNSDYVDYRIRDLLFDDRAYEQLNKTPFDKIYIVFYPDKVREERFNFRDLIWSDSLYDRVMDRILEVDDVVFRLYR